MFLGTSTNSWRRALFFVSGNTENAPRLRWSVALRCGEFEFHFLASQFFVDRRKGVNFVLDVRGLLRVEIHLGDRQQAQNSEHVHVELSTGRPHDLADLRSVQAMTSVLSHDLCRVHQVLKNRLVHRS